MPTQSANVPAGHGGSGGDGTECAGGCGHGPEMEKDCSDVADCREM